MRYFWYGGFLAKWNQDEGLFPVIVYPDGEEKKLSLADLLHEGQEITEEAYNLALEEY